VQGQIGILDSEQVFPHCRFVFAVSPLLPAQIAPQHFSDFLSALGAQTSMTGDSMLISKAVKQG